MDQKPHSYKSKGKQILGLLADLRADSVTGLQAAMSTFRDSEQAQQSIIGIQTVEKENQGRIRDEQDQIFNVQSGKATQLTADKAQAQKDHDADVSFLDELNSECEYRAKEWNHYSQVRKDEITQIGKAIQILVDGDTSGK